MKPNEKAIKEAVKGTNGKADKLAKLYDAVEEMFVLGLFTGLELDAYTEAIDGYIDELYGSEGQARVFSYMNGGACV